MWLVDDNGKKQGEGIIEKVLKKPTKTNVARVKAAGMENDALLNITGFIVKETIRRRSTSSKSRSVSRRPMFAIARTYLWTSYFPPLGIVNISPSTR